MKGESTAEKATYLNLAGFTNIEIADLLQTTTATIKQSLYLARKKAKR
jgi:DNA-directed RNA polymerase specialized sigma24 family protein